MWNSGLLVYAKTLQSIDQHNYCSLLWYIIIMGQHGYPTASNKLSHAIVETDVFCGRNCRTDTNDDTSSFGEEYLGVEEFS